MRGARGERPIDRRAPATIGRNRDGIDMARVQDVETGTAAVTTSMTAVPGLRSQQAFFFRGIDPVAKARTHGPDRSGS